MPVDFHKHEHVAVITLNRPEARNAIDPETMVRLADAWKNIRDDDDIRVAILTGTGTDSFCSGADLKRMVTLISGMRSPEDHWDRAVLEDIFVIGRALLRDFDPVKPVIAAVNGSAVAGGMELLLGTDIRVVSEAAQLGLQEVKWGLFPIGGSTVRLPRQIPHAVAMEMMLTGELISAQRAHALGLVNHVVPPGEVMNKAMALAQRLAENGPLAVREIRRSVRENIGKEEVDALENERLIGTPIFFSEDAKEGPRAYAERRKPMFKGR